MKKSILTLASILPLFAFGRDAVAENSSPFGGMVGVIFVIGVFIIIFFALRQVMLWYWKVEIILRKQNEQTILLRSIHKSLEENNRLTKTQIELVIGKDIDDEI